MPKKIDLSELFGSPVKQDDRLFSRPIAQLHEFYLSGEIESSENYIEWFQTIRHASEADIIKIYINSPGGDAFTAIQFIRAIQESDATIIMSVEGMCASAATMIFLQGHSFEVSEHSVFLFHNYSGGTVGKGGEMWQQLQHERKWSESLMKGCYDGFLTEKEISSLLDNKDIWMDGSAVIKRLKAKGKKMQKDESATKKPVDKDTESE
jgi:ATP-dependent protease ClpP protease subunit